MEAKDDRVWTGADGMTATIRYITDHNGYTYQPIGNYWVHGSQVIGASFLVTKSWQIYVELPQGDNDSGHAVAIVTYFNDGYGHQKNLVWTFYDEGTRYTFAGSPVNSIAQQQYQHYNPGGWELDGKHYDYAHYIYWFDDDTHTSYNDDWNNGSLISHTPVQGPMYWNWVYTYHPTGYYRYIESDCYAYDTNGNITSGIGFRYRLLGSVLFDENNGTGKSSKQNYQFGMDIIDPNTKSMQLGDRNIVAPTKTGSTFLGWGTEKDSSTIYSKWNWNPYPYCDNADDTMTLYAQWVNNEITLN
ncbi:hypothetical protein ACKX2L_06110 [Lachnospiraceae bacterium YH-ros2228]